MQIDHILENKFKREVAKITKKYKGQLEMNYMEETCKCSCCNKDYRRILVLNVNGLEFGITYQNFHDIEYLATLPNGNVCQIKDFQNLTQVMEGVCDKFTMVK